MVQVALGKACRFYEQLVTGDRLRVRYGGGVGLFVDIRGDRCVTLSLLLSCGGAALGNTVGMGKG